MATFNSNNDIIVNKSISVLAKLNKQECINIRNTVIHLFENIDYRTPSDRCICIDAEINISSSNKMYGIINITPCFRGELRNNKKDNCESLHRTLTLITSPIECNIDNLNKGGQLEKELKWVLNYFGMTILYSRKHMQIKVNCSDKNNIEVTYI